MALHVYDTAVIPARMSTAELKTVIRISVCLCGYVFSICFFLYICVPAQKREA